MTPTQPDLFAEGPAAPVDVSPSAEALRELAETLPPNLRLGTSSWTFPGWEGLVWDRTPSPRVLSTHGLTAYARHPLLRCVGLDRTYYDTLEEQTFGLYREQVPDDFRFIVKADRRLLFVDGPGSDPDLFLNPVWAADRVIAPASDGLGITLGSILFQFPPLADRALGGPRAFAERVYRFLDALPDGPHYTVEIRTAAFLTRDYMAAVHHAGAGHAYVVHPTMPSVVEQLDAVPPARETPAVVRWMLQPGHRYAEARETWAPFARLQAPDPERRSDVAETVRRILEIGANPHVVVNNKAEGSAPASIAGLARELHPLLRS
jgi:uncharacterized protein YecE (DUF72 family)